MRSKQHTNNSYIYTASSTTALSIIKNWELLAVFVSLGTQQDFCVYTQLRTYLFGTQKYYPHLP